MGSQPSPFSCGVFLLLPLLQAFLFLVAGRVLPLLPSPAGLFIYSSVGDCPSSPFGAQGSPPSLLCVFFVVVYYSVSRFSLDGGRSLQGAMLIWPRVVCGSNTCCLAHLVVRVFPSGLGAGIWRHESLPGFSVQHGVGMLHTGWECGGVKVLSLRGGFSCKVCLQRLSKIFRKHAFCFLPLVTILEYSSVLNSLLR
jgi:hypothetical protein